MMIQLLIWSAVTGRLYHNLEMVVVSAFAVGCGSLYGNSHITTFTCCLLLGVRGEGSFQEGARGSCDDDCKLGSLAWFFMHSIQVSWS